MKKSTLILSIVVTLLLGGVAWAYSNWKAYAPSTYVQETTDQNGTTTSTTVNTATGTSTPGSPSFTMADVATHKDASSCYAVIDGKVYDLTLWVNVHPGGKAAILSLCGTDGTARFRKQHGTSTKPNATLARFLIGTVSQ